MTQPLAIALVHHPVLDKRGDRVTSAVTNLDVHDIARTACTYGVQRFYLVTPVTEQLQLVERILDHWRDGFGADYNPKRRQALQLVTPQPTLEAALQDWATLSGGPARPVLTGARVTAGQSFADCRAQLAKTPLLLVFGTGWGLAPELFDHGWPALEPIRGQAGYNHLPVRAAVAIMLDRLLGRSTGPE